MPELESSHLKSAEYDPASRTLVVSFRNGRSYKYKKVPRKFYDGLLAAPSAGEYFARNIRAVFAGTEEKRKNAR